MTGGARSAIVNRGLPSPAMGVAVLALVLSFGGGAYAAISAVVAKPIVVCVHGHGGGLYMARHCAGRDRQLRFSPFGADTTAGSQGAPGTAGAQGMAGSPGTTGLQGPQGLQGTQGPADGPAGGDLKGSFPNPVVASGAITASKLATASVTQSKLATTLVIAQQQYGANSIEGATAHCPVEPRS